MPSVCKTGGMTTGPTSTNVPNPDPDGPPLEFKVHGLDCAEEVAILKRAVGPLVDGEERLAFDVLRGKMTVLPPQGWNADHGAPDRRPTLEQVMDAVAATGMAAEPWHGAEERARRRAAESGVAAFWRRHRRGFAVAASGALLVAGFLAHAAATGSAGLAFSGGIGEIGGLSGLVARAGYLLSIAAVAWFVLPKAWFAVRNLRPDMHLLMSAAVAGALVLGEWLEGASVAFLFAVSLELERWSVGRARRAVEALLDLSPATARLLTDDGEREVPAAEVAPGSRFLVRPGERVPLDGEVAAGASDVDQAPITGESVPVAKTPGDEVFAGTVNGAGALEVVSTRPPEDTTLARIIRLVEAAQARRSPSQRWVDRFARVYTPAVIGLALAVILLPPLVAGGDWTTWFYRGLVLLVLGCPCALVISTPVSVVAALAAAARAGVLIKGGRLVEAPADLAAVAFDKTGTLTSGEFRVVDVEALGGHDESEVLARAAALESRSEHPLARAVVEHARSAGVRPAPAANVRALPGRGAEGEIGGRRFWIGAPHRFLADSSKGSNNAGDSSEPNAGDDPRSGDDPSAGDQRLTLPPDLARRVADFSARREALGQTVVALGDGESVWGLLALMDTPRPAAAKVVAELHRLGVEHTVLLTGDHDTAAHAAAAATGVREVRADLLPEDKVTAVEELVERYGRVAMVGDGVNDAPALARSSLGIAMGAAGTGVALETADVALMGDDLGRLPWLVTHSRRTLRVIRQNVAFALGVKLVVFLLALAGVATLWMAIAADMGASLLVIANGLRLLRGRQLT